MTLLKITCRLFLKLFIITALILAITTCKEDAPTEPEGGNTNNNILTSSTIGPSGGELKTDDFSLSVPAGSFQSETTLSLSISDEPSPFGESCISKSNEVLGIPNNFDKPIRIQIKYDGTIRDSSYIGIGFRTMDDISGDSTITYRFISAKDSSGFLVGYFKYETQNDNPQMGVTKSYTSSHVLWFTAYSSFNKLATWHFIIKAPIGWSYGALENFANLLEQQYAHITENLKFSYYNKRYNGNCKSNYSKWRWPIQVIVNQDEKITTLDYSQGWIGPQMVVNGSLLTASETLETKNIVGKSLLKISLNTYDNYCNEKKWLKTAIIYWFEDYYDGVANDWIPSSFSGNELTPFNGLQFGGYTLSRGHGQGMVSLLQYLASEKNIYPSDMFLNIHEANIHPVEYILDHANTFVAEWWPDYFEKLIGGQIYDVNSSVFLDSKSLGETWNINSNSNTEESFILEYPDLSTKRFIINLNYSDIDESAKLSVDAFGLNNDGIATIVFGVRSNNELQHILTTKNAPAEIPKSLKNYYDEGTRKFLVVVVNSIHNATDYLGKTDIELQMRITKNGPTPDYNQCGIVVYCGTRYAYTTPDTSYESVNNKVSNGTWQRYPGSFSGNTFNASYHKSWDSQTNPLTITGTITATFNNDYTMITTVTWNETHTTNHASSSEDLTATNIPLDELEWGTIYQVKGEETCNHITTLTDVQNAPDGLSWTLPEYWCNGDSKIYISFSKE